jgi:protein-S-isoprenylcysteine O-methyltransferase Ste14
MTEAKPVPALRLTAAALYVAAWPALMFVLAGDARWLEGWLFTGWLLGLYATITIWLYRKDPALLAERHRRPPRGPTAGTTQQSGRDRIWVLLLVLGFAAWIVMMPLDARRFGWTPGFSWPAKAAGAALLLASAFLLFRAFHDNTFLSSVVRIQEERKQRVVSTGAYGFVRHPMYLGMILMFSGTPLLLGSAAGLAIAVVMTVVLAARIIGEERLLAGELDGYEEYRRRVRYRLMPLIW